MDSKDAIKSNFSLEFLRNYSQQYGYITKEMFENYIDSNFYKFKLVDETPEFLIYEVFSSLDYGDYLNYFKGDGYYYDSYRYGNRNIDFISYYRHYKFNVKKELTLSWEVLYTSLGKDFKNAGSTEKAQYELLKEGILSLKQKADSLNSFKEKLLNFKDYIEKDNSPDYFLTYIKNIESQLVRIENLRKINRESKVKKILSKSKNIKYDFNILIYDLDESKYENLTTDANKFFFSFKNPKDSVDFKDYDFIVTKQSHSNLEEGSIFFYDSDNFDIEKFTVRNSKDVIKLIEELNKADYRKVIIDQIEILDDVWYSKHINKYFFVKEVLGQLLPIGYLHNDKPFIWELDSKEIVKSVGTIIVKEWEEEVEESIPQLKEDEFVKMIELQNSDLSVISEFLENVNINKKDNIKIAHEKLKKYINDKITQLEL